MQTLNAPASGYRRGIRITGIAAVLGALIAMTACSSAPSDSESMMVGSTESEDNRDASVYFNKFRVCIQNKTSGNLDLEWDSSMQNDQGEYLNADQLKTTLGPDAFSCAVSFAELTLEAAEWKVAGYQMFAEVDARAWYVYSAGAELIPIKPNAPVTQVLQSPNKPTLRYESSTNGVLRTFDKVKAYPIDVRFFNEPSQ